MDNEIDNDCFCELCSLDFTASRELEEHTWSILHNTNLNRKKGRDCAHPCSLCKQEFTGLLEFASHLHGETHQEKIHEWRKDRQEEWSPDKQQQESPEKEKPQPSDQHKPQNPEKQKLARPSQEREGGELSDWAADDLTGVKDFQDYSSDQGGEVIMDDYRRGHQNHQRWPGRGPPRGIPSLLDRHLPPVGLGVEYGYRYRDDVEMRRDRGPNQPWPQERREPNDEGYPVWDGYGRERDFRGPSYDPGYAGMNLSRSSDGWENESYYGSREGDRMLSRDRSRSYPNESFSDDYAPGLRRRVFVEGQPGDPRDRINRRGSNPSHQPHNGRQRVNSVVGSRENKERPYSRQNRRESPADRSHRETPPHKQDQGRWRRSQENKQGDSKERSQVEMSPSESPSGKSSRKSKPRKLARSEEINKVVSGSDKTDSKSAEVNVKPSKDKESERKNRDETKTMEKENSQTESVSSSQQVDGNQSGKSTMNSSGLLSKDTTVKERSMMKSDADSKGNTSLPTKKKSTSSSKGDADSPTPGGLSSSPAIGKSASSLKKDTSSPSSKGDVASSGSKNTSPPSAKGDSSSTGKKQNPSPSAKSPSSVKKGSSLSTKKNANSPNKEHSISPAKRVLPSSATVQSSSSARGDSAASADTQETAVKNVNPSDLKPLGKQDKLTNGKELVTCIPEKETLVTSRDEKTSHSQDSGEAVDTVPIVKEKEVTVDQVGTVPFSVVRAKKDLASSVKEQTQSLSSVLKDKEDSTTHFSKNTNNSLPGNKTDKTNDNRESDISGKYEQRSKLPTFSTINTLPWGQREEQLRALLGIKTEPKDLEDQRDATTCTVPKLTGESQTNCPISSGSTPTVSSTSSVISKPNTSRHVPVVSQLSLSRPQCSFVHIDGVQCGAVTWNKYCSYHQRVFKSDEEDARGRGLVAEGSQFRRNDSESFDSARKIAIGRQSGTQIFRPVTPPYDPPERFTVDGVKTRQTQEDQSENGRNAKTSCEEIDLNSTVPYVALRDSNGPGGNIDLSTTVRAATRNLFLRESSASASGRPNIDLADTVPSTERDGGITLEDTTADTGIDLSGTVPNLEELLALHGSSSDNTSGPNIDLNKTGLKHGQSWNKQRFKSGSGPNVDRNLTAPYHGAAVHLGGDTGASIELSETVAQPGRSRAPLDSIRFGNTDHKKAQTEAGNRLEGSSVVQHLQRNTDPDRESTSATTNSNVKTEMIDLNLSTKLLGVPHSVVTPFNTSIPSPKGPAREMSKSPSEFSTKSSILASQVYSPSSRGSTSPMPGEQSPSPSISLQNFSLDLTRFNLPPAVRKALAERFSGKKVSSTSSAEVSDGRRSQPLFTDLARTEGQIEPGKKLSPLPARLRSRGQRSVSLDSPLIRKENLHVEGSSRSVLLERGNIYDMNRFLSRPSSEMSEGRDKTKLISSGHNSEGLFKKSTVVFPSTNVPSPRTQSTTAIVQEDSNELQSRGLIDLSSTSYLGEMSVASANHGRSPSATRLTTDKSRSHARPSELQSRGLIDLNTSMELSTRDTAGTEALSVIKRKRVNSTEGSETSSSSGTEKLVKRLKHEQESDREDAAATYRPGINVQELLTIEREEQNQLQNLHAVQSRLKSVRAQIQKLCTELDSLSSEEQRITLKMGELRNQRLSILENACYERQGSVTRTETVTRESSTSTADGNRSLSSSSVFSGPGKGYTLELSSSARQNDSQDDILRVKKKIEHGSFGMDAEQTASGGVFVFNNTSHDKDEEPLLNVSNFSGGSKLEAHVSVGTATKFVLRGEKGEKVLAKLHAVKQTESSNELLNFNEVAENVIQASETQISESREFAQRISAKKHDSDPSGGKRDYGHGALTAPGTCGDASVQNQNSSNKVNETRKDLMKKMKQVHLPDKGPFRKKSFSDVNISKTIEANRKKIQSVRDNIKRWKSQEESEGLNGPKRKHSSSSSLESVENPLSSDLDEDGSSYKLPVRDKTASKKTTKELKKSSLFQSGKKSAKELRKNKMDKTQPREKEKSNQAAAVPVKRRKLEDTSCNTSSFVLSKEKTSSKEKGQVVSAAAHTTTTDLRGSGSEERSNTEDEIPTRDVDNQSRNTSSKNSRRAGHLQIPSSTVETLKKNLQNGKDGRQRGPLATKFPGHTGAVCGLKVHNGHLYTCSADKTTRSFNIQTGQCVKMYQGHHQAVNCLEVSAEKDRLFTGSNDQTVRSYNIKSGVCTHRFTHDGRVMCLHAAFDLLFVGLSTGVVASIDLVNNKCLERLHCHEPRGVSCLTTATEGQRKLLCSGSFDSTIAIRDCQSGLLIRTLCDHNMTVLCLQVVENILYSGSADMKVQAHNLNSGELLRSFEGHTMSVSGLQIIGSVLVTSCLDKLIRCYDLTSADLVQVYGGQMDMIFSVHVNNGRIYSGARDGSVVAVKLDLRVYHPCKWKDCNLNFGVVTHLKNHIREYHVMEQGTVAACHWALCGHQFSADDDISVVLKHVLGHVVTRTARKSAS